MKCPNYAAGAIKRRGTRNGASKLDEAKVREIRRRYVRGMGGHPSVSTGNARALAAEFAINKRTVLGIVNFETWGWVE